MDEIHVLTDNTCRHVGCRNPPDGKGRTTLCTEHHATQLQKWQAANDHRRQRVANKQRAHDELVSKYDDLRAKYDELRTKYDELRTQIRTQLRDRPRH